MKSKSEQNSTVKKVASAVLSVIYFTVLAVLLFFGVVGTSLTDWCEETFHTSFREIIYTYMLGLEGADVGFFGEAVRYCIVWIILFAVLLVLIILADIAFSKFDLRRAERKYERSESSHAGPVKFIYRTLVIAICFLAAARSFVYADKFLNVSRFIKMRFVYSNLYEKEYVDFRDVEITGNPAKRNVIILYLESMESTYTSTEEGGPLEVNLIPKLTALARENVSFGDRAAPGELRGTHNPIGTTWTTSALLASSSGIPFALKVGKNQFGKGESSVIPDFVTIGDFLKEEGYYQEFMCGSEAEFGGKKAFFQGHGDYEIFDYNTAIEKKYIDPDYKVWWGLEDHKLYEMAKDELLRISAKDQPFNFTMLTVDTHHVGGYKCKWCGSKHKIELADVIACADKQAAEFISWCRKQDFFENTTIVILGDHPRMDKVIVKREKNRFNRCTYNCFINPLVSGSMPDQNRLATTMDLFPTILSSMGYTIKGNRLGLGTDLFSDRPTLAEEMTYDELNDELGKNSRFYMEHFG